MKAKRLWKPRDFVIISDEAGKKKGISVAAFCRMLLFKKIDGEINSAEFEEKLRSSFPKNLSLFDRQQDTKPRCHCCLD